MIELQRDHVAYDAYTASNRDRETP